MHWTGEHRGAHPVVILAAANLFIGFAFIKSGQRFCHGDICGLTVCFENGANTVVEAASTA
jgi:hypothetical protein